MLIKKIKKKTIPKFVIYGVIVFVAWTIATGLSRLALFHHLDKKLRDWQFTLGKDIKPDSNLVLVLIDDETRQKIGDAPYPRAIFTRLVHGLEAAGARVIGLDFRFDGPQSVLADSLLADIAINFDNVLFACSFRNIYLADSQISSYPDSSDSDISTGFFEADEISLPFPELAEKVKQLSQVNLFIDDLDGATRSLPLYVSHNGNQYPAFALEIVKKYWNIDNNSIKMTFDKIILVRGEKKLCSIPVGPGGEFYINYSLYKNLPGKYFSVAALLDYFNNPDDVPPGAMARRIFQHKIVLIGSLVDEDLFHTPFSVLSPGVLIHATAIDNILNQNFLRQPHKPLQILVSILPGLILVIALLKFRLVWQILTVPGLIIFYLVVLYGMFYYHTITLPIFNPLSFIILAIFAGKFYDYLDLLIKYNHLKVAIQSQSDKLERFAQKSYGKPGKVNVLRIFILLVQISQDHFFFFHWLQKKTTSEGQSVNQFPKFGFRFPVLIKNNELNLILNKLQNICRDYILHFHNNDKKQNALVQRLQNFGQKLHRDFTLTTRFNVIFQRNEKSLHLHFFVDDARIPWQMVYSTTEKLFLCEKFPMGISFTGSQDENVPTRKLMQQKIYPEKKTAIIFSGDWQNDPIKKLKYAQYEVNHLTALLKTKADVIHIKDHVNDFFNSCNLTRENHHNTRIIHYVGHAEDDYLDVAPGQVVKPGMMKEIGNFYFHSRPLVFLNACYSGKIECTRDKYKNLATEFLACGAGACIATIAQVHEESSAQFASRFYYYFLEETSTAGEALRQTRMELTRPGKNYDPDGDITRYLYVLYGDPTVRY